MTIAIVKDGQFLHTKPSGEQVRDSQGVMRPRCVDPAEGWYEFIAARNEAPEGKKAQGTVCTVGDGVVTESFLYVDMTEQEIKDKNNAPIWAQIKALEASEMAPRMLRDLAFKSAAEDAAKLGLTLDQVYAMASQPDAPEVAKAYKRFKDFDSSIAALKARLI